MEKGNVRFHYSYQTGRPTYLQLSRESSRGENKMGVSIHTIFLGFDNVYVVKDKGVIMIDSGDPKKAKPS